MPAGIPNRASLSYISKQMDDVVLLLQTSQQGLNAREDCCGGRGIVVPVNIRICFEKIVKSTVNGANKNPWSMNLIFGFYETDPECPLFCPRGSRLRQYNWPCQPWGEGAFCRLYIPPLHIIDPLSSHPLE